MDESVSSSTTVYIGNTRTVSNEDLYNYCSNFGLVLDFSRRLLSPEQSHLVDFTFLRFSTRQSTSRFLSISSHILKNDLTLDVRPFSEILHLAVPLQVDRKICIGNVSGDISISDLRKYLRTFGSIKQATSDIGQDEQRYVYVEFESAASRNKLLKGKVAVHRVRDERLNIFPMLRPTEVNLHRINDENMPEPNVATNGSQTLLHLEAEYSLTIRDDFNRINSTLTDFLKEQRHYYEQLRNMIES